MHFLASVEYILLEGSCVENATRLCRVGFFTCNLVTWASNWCRRILNLFFLRNPCWNPLSNLWVIIIRTGLHLVTILKWHRAPLLPTETSLLFYLESSSVTYWDIFVVLPWEFICYILRQLCCFTLRGASTCHVCQVIGCTEKKARAASSNQSIK